MPELGLASINWLAVGVGAVVSFLIGGAWYAGLFGKAWARAYGYTDEQLKAMNASPPRTFSILFLCDALIALVIAVVARWTGVTSAVGGIVLAVTLWLGIAMANSLAVQVASARPLRGFAIDTGKQLVAMCAVGAIIGAWR